MTGSNTGENHPIIALQMKEAVQKYGAKMIVVDPRRSETADFADIHLAVTPGRDAWCLAAILLDLGAHPVELLLGTSGQDHGRAQAGQLMGNAAAEATTATGNDYACNARGGPPRDRKAQAGELYILGNRNVEMQEFSQLVWAAAGKTSSMLLKLPVSAMKTAGTGSSASAAMPIRFSAESWLM